MGRLPSLDPLVGGPGTGPAFSSPGNGLKCLRQNKGMERDNRAARLCDCAPCVLVLLAVLSQRCGITVKGHPRLLVCCCSFVSPSNGGVRPRQLYLETRTIVSATSDNTDKMNGNPPRPNTGLSKHGDPVFSPDSHFRLGGGVGWLNHGW